MIMFTNYSMTGVGGAVYIVALALRALGIDSIEHEQIAQFIVNLAGVVGFVFMVWGQLRRKDLSWGFWRK